MLGLKLIHIRKKCPRCSTKTKHNKARICAHFPECNVYHIVYYGRLHYIATWAWWCLKPQMPYPFVQHWTLGDLSAILKMKFSILFYWLVSWAPMRTLRLARYRPWKVDSCHNQSIMRSFLHFLGRYLVKKLFNKESGCETPWSRRGVSLQWNIRIHADIWLSRSQ